MRRKLGTPVPSNLQITSGEIVLNNGERSAEYLLKWQAENNIDPGTSVCVVTRESLQKVEDELAFWMAMICG